MSELKWNPAEVIGFMTMAKTISDRPPEEITGWKRQRNLAFSMRADTLLYCFRLLLQDHPPRRSFSITFQAATHQSPWVAFCRYDIQDNEHDNEAPPCPPTTVSTRAPHRHVYNVIAVGEGLEWDACAELLPMGPLDKTHVLGRALADLNVRFANPNAHELVFEWAK